MKNIVSEVLNRNRTETPARVQEESRAGSQQVHQVSASNNQIPGIYRPNYQRQKRQSHRLAVANGSKPEKPNSAPPHHPGPLTRDFVENQLSALQRLTTAQINQGSAMGASSSAPGILPSAQLIGKTRKDQYVWYFPSLNHRLGSAGEESTVGFITGVACHPGTLFLIDERLNLTPEITCEPFGEKKSNRFVDTVRFRAKDQRMMESFLKDLYIQLNRSSIRPLESFVSEKPTRFLFDSLSFTVNASIAALTGISAISGMALLDRFFYQNPQVSLQFDLRENCLLIAGPYGIVRNAIKQIEDDAAQLLR